MFGCSSLWQTSSSEGQLSGVTPVYTIEPSTKPQHVEGGWVCFLQTKHAERAGSWQGGRVRGWFQQNRLEGLYGTSLLSYKPMMFKNPPAPQSLNSCPFYQALALLPVVAQRQSIQHFQIFMKH